MTSATVKVFDTTLHTTNAWLSDLMSELGCESHHRAYHALRAVLHVLRDRLTVDEVADLSAQLPMLVRGFYYEGWRPSGKHAMERTKEEFIEHVAKDFREFPPIDAEEVTRAVFRVLNRHVTSGEVDDVKRILPAELRELWP